MERIIGVNPVIEVLQNKEKNIEKLEMFKGNKDEKLNKIKKLASERNIHVLYIIIMPDIRGSAFL